MYQEEPSCRVGILINMENLRTVKSITYYLLSIYYVPCTMSSIKEYYSFSQKNYSVSQFSTLTTGEKTESNYDKKT